MTTYAMFCISQEGAEPVLCDVAGVVCYSASSDIQKVQAECAEANERAEEFGHKSRYVVGLLPGGFEIPEDENEKPALTTAQKNELQTGFREYLSVHETLYMGGHEMDSLAKDLTGFVLASLESFREKGR